MADQKYGMKNPRPIPKSVFELFLRDPDIPQGIRWAVDRKGIKKGDPAGSLKNHGYYRTGIDGVLFLNHRIIYMLDAGQDPGNKVVDHVKETTNNNDIQLCTQKQNVWRKKPRKNGTSQYKGVSWIKDRKRWYAQLWKNGVRKHQKWFKDEVEAALFYDQCALLEFGEFAHLNFPNYKEQL